MPQLSLHSPIGDLTVFSDEGANGSEIVALDWGWVPAQSDDPLLLRARHQLEKYFDGDTTPFDLPLDPAGSPFHLSVWTAMREIPYGATMTYGDIARGLKTSPRAVGLACGHNPVPIIIPCHRVVGAHGGLGGYSGDGGTTTKEALLRLEGAPGFEPDFFDSH